MESYCEYMQEIQMENLEGVDTLGCLLGVTNTSLEEAPRNESLYHALHEYLWTLKAIEIWLYGESDDNGAVDYGVLDDFREYILGLCPDLNSATYEFYRLLVGQKPLEDACNLNDQIAKCHLTSMQVECDENCKVGIFLYYLKKVVEAVLLSPICEIEILAVPSTPCVQQ